MLSEIRNLLTTLDSVGIAEVAIEEAPDEKGFTLVRGADSKNNIVVFHKINGEYVDAMMGVQTVRGLLARIDLFDISKAQMSSSVNNGYITDITLKQGRRTSTFRCADPKRLQIPKRVPSNLNLDQKIVLPGDYVANITTAISAMGLTGSKMERNISLSLKGDVLTTTIFDGEDDNFSDEFIVDGGQDLDDFTSTWDIPAFQLVLKESKAANNGDAVFAVSEHKIGIFDIGLVNVLLIPLTK